MVLQTNDKDHINFTEFLSIVCDHGKHIEKNIVDVFDQL